MGKEPGKRGLIKNDREVYLFLKSEEVLLVD